MASGYDRQTDFRWPLPRAGRLNIDKDKTDVKCIKCRPMGKVTLKPIRNGVSPLSLKDQTTQDDQTKPKSVCALPTFGRAA